MNPWETSIGRKAKQAGADKKDRCAFVIIASAEEMAELREAWESRTVGGRYGGCPDSGPARFSGYMIVNKEGEAYRLS